MATGSQKSNSNSKKVNQATKPMNFSSPWGSVTSSKSGISFNPVQSADQLATQGLTDSKILGVIQGLPTTYDVNAAYNNPYFDTVASLYKRDIDSQRAQDTREFERNLNARNQIGSSYEAYYRNLMEKDYGGRYADANDKARLASSDAYNQSINQGLNVLAGLRNDRNSALDAAMAPFKLAMGYQSALTPLQTAQANNYSSLAQIQAQRPTWGDRLWDLGIQGLRTGGQIASAAAGAPIMV